uniref:Uncharacterized protein n=1 Tax=Globodera rostochiensis TaxID=31243 RepID=A0A914HQV3_GLORO
MKKDFLSVGGDEEEEKIASPPPAAAVSPNLPNPNSPTRTRRGTAFWFSIARQTDVSLLRRRTSTIGERPSAALPPSRPGVFRWSKRGKRESRRGSDHGRAVIGWERHSRARKER